MAEESKYKDFGVDDVNVAKDVKSRVNNAMGATIPSTIADICGISKGDDLYWDWYEDDNGNRLPRVVNIEER